MLLKPDVLNTKSAVDFKALSDLDGGFAERSYKLPNPFYFVP